MRFFFSGPRIFGVRPGVSLGPEDFKGSARQSRAGWVHAHDLQQPAAQQPPPDAGGFIYVIKGEHNLIKVGVSTNPLARLAQLRTASPFPIDFAYVCAVEGGAAEAYALEAEAHRMLQNQRLSGEWFDIPSEMAVAALAAAGHRSGRRFVQIAPENIGAVIQAAKAPTIQEPQVQTMGMPTRITLMVIATAIAAFGSTLGGLGLGVSLALTLTTALIALIWISVT